MSWNEIKKHIASVDQIVDGWASGSEVSDLEKDLALEKLRRIYEVIKSAGCESHERQGIHVESGAETGTKPLKETASETVELSTDNVLSEINETVEVSDDNMAKSRIDRKRLLSLYDDCPPPQEYMHNTDAESPQGRGSEIKPKPVPAVSVPKDSSMAAHTPVENEPADDVDMPRHPNMYGRSQRGTWSESEEWQETKSESQQEPEAWQEVRKESREEAKHESRTEPQPQPGSRTEVQQQPQPGSRTEPKSQPEPRTEVRSEAWQESRKESREEARQEQGSGTGPEQSTGLGLRDDITPNDRFVMIRDMFGSDAEAYEQAIDTFDCFTDLDDAVVYIYENFSWNPDDEGVRRFIDILARKLT